MLLAESLFGWYVDLSMAFLPARLVPTQESVKKTRAGVLAYGAALDKIL